MERIVNKWYIIIWNYVYDMHNNYNNILILYIYIYLDANFIIDSNIYTDRMIKYALFPMTRVTFFFFFSAIFDGRSSCLT